MTSYQATDQVVTVRARPDALAGTYPYARTGALNDDISLVLDMTGTFPRTLSVSVNAVAPKDKVQVVDSVSVIEQVQNPYTMVYVSEA